MGLIHKKQPINAQVEQQIDVPPLPSLTLSSLFFFSLKSIFKKGIYKEKNENFLFYNLPPLNPLPEITAINDMECVIFRVTSHPGLPGLRGSPGHGGFCAKTR